MKRIGWIAITDHNSIEGARSFDRFCKKMGNHVQVIIGEEIYTTDGEIIGLFLQKKIEPLMSSSQTIEEIKKQGGLVCVPHPFDKERVKTVLHEACIEKNSDSVNFVEIHNGRNKQKEYDFKQNELAKKYSLSPIIGSDAHTAFEIGRNYCVVEDCDLSDPESFSQAIMNCEFYQSNCLLLSLFITKCVRAVKMVFRGDFNELYRTVTRRIKTRKY